ncbi:hypothetical protein [Paraliomyxa miuraensis]|uniref:hypothetical protein n=1 Tax=Paraliomyxa miuraensis TaxID=376150 RepID=UPI002257F7EB|nr:hypothetical protein [Paraliomyxa miuraensis]MCX4245539.1 hypothetical protein [Paraliomyxa miuraensis]
MRGSLPLVCAVLVLSIEGIAHACSGCPEPGIAPELPQVPVNALGVLWGPYPSMERGDPVLTDLDTMLTIPLETFEIGPDVYLHPAQPVEIGHAYHFATPGKCMPMGPEHVLVAGDPIEVPEVPLGTLAATAPVLGSVSRPADISCSESVDAMVVDVTLALDPALEPLADLLMYETYVDGMRWRPITGYFSEPAPGESWVGRGEDRIYAICIDGEGGSPTPRVVQMRARIAGFPEVTFDSDELEIVLDCQSDAGSSSGADGSGGETGEGSGGGSVGEPTSAADDATAASTSVGSGAGTDGTQGSSGGDGGLSEPGSCACRSGSGGAGGMGLLGLLLLGRFRRRSMERMAPSRAPAP